MAQSVAKQYLCSVLVLMIMIEDNDLLIFSFLPKTDAIKAFYELPLGFTVSRVQFVLRILHPFLSSQEEDEW